MFQKTKQKLNMVSTDDSSGFWVNSGPVLRNLKDLKEALMKMSEDTFKYHVNKEKNDFAAWVKNILRDDTLAAKLLKTKSIKTALRAVESRLKKYNEGQ